MLLPTVEDVTSQKACNKRYALAFLGSIDFQIIFALLTEVGVFHIQVTIVQIKVPGL